MYQWKVRGASLRRESQRFRRPSTTPAKNSRCRSGPAPGAASPYCPECPSHMIRLLDCQSEPALRTKPCEATLSGCSEQGGRLLLRGKLEGRWPRGCRNRGCRHKWGRCRQHLRLPGPPIEGRGARCKVMSRAPELYGGRTSAHVTLRLARHPRPMRRPRAANIDDARLARRHVLKKATAELGSRANGLNFRAARHITEALDRPRRRGRRTSGKTDSPGRLCWLVQVSSKQRLLSSA